MQQPKATQMMEKSLGVLGLCVIFIIILVFFVIKPLVPKLKDQNVKIKVAHWEYNTKKQKVDNYSTLKSQIENNKNEIKKLSLSLPSEQDIPELFMQLQTISQNSQLTILSITPTAKEFVQTAAAPTTTEATGQSQEKTNQTNTATSQTNIAPLGFSLAFDQAGFPAFLSFLQNVENNLRVIKVKSFSLSADASGNLSSSLIFETYYQQGGKNE